MTGTDQLFHTVAGSLLEAIERRPAMDPGSSINKLELAVKLSYAVRTFTRKEEAGTLTDEEQAAWAGLQELLRRPRATQDAPADPGIPEFLT